MQYIVYNVYQFKVAPLGERWKKRMTTDIVKPYSSMNS